MDYRNWLVRNGTAYDSSPQYDYDRTNDMGMYEKYAANKINQLRQPSPVKRQNKVAKNAYVRSQDPQFEDAFGEPIGTPMQGGRWATGQQYENPFPSNYVGDQGQIPRNTPDSIGRVTRTPNYKELPKLPNGNPINRLAGPKGVLPGIFNVLGILQGARDIQDQVDQVGGWKNWLFKQTYVPDGRVY